MTGHLLLGLAGAGIGGATFAVLEFAGRWWLDARRDRVVRRAARALERAGR